ncbi:MAG: hypothetical protein A2X36_13790 [Elusimicrobia bacterium GWA2_69_24]|nr:MAG: hypothetical protein A2X36_13790 [Elusimicrobia bacterium GWA2_69_24]HBL18146.1 hypothetical protein [Elusimicrobiota bacterium]
MANKLTLFVLSLLLLPRLSAAQLQLPSFEAIREAARGRDAAAPTFTPAKYKTQPGPGSVVPAQPPNLKLSQVIDLVKRLEDIERKKTGRSTLSADPKNSRLVSRLAEIDITFVDPIPAERWNGILKEMGDTAESQFDAAGGNWSKLIDLMLKKAVSSLKDPHSMYLNSEEYKRLQEQLQGSFAGFGISIKESPEGLGVEGVFPRSGAAKAGLAAGDVITEVDGVVLKGKPLEAMMRLVRGAEGSQSKAFFLRGGRRYGPVTVTRVKVEMPNAYAKMAADRIGYVYFNQFQEDTDQRFFELVKSLQAQGAKAVVIDVRGNPGGRLDTASSIVSEFLSDGAPIVALKKQGQVQVSFITDGDGMFQGLPMAVLINGHSASASEILAGAFQDLKKAVVIGSRSYGKGTAQGISPEPGGEALKLTGSRWYTPADRSIDGARDPATGAVAPGTGGVMPDVVVDVPDEAEARILGDIMRELNGLPLTGPRAPDPVLEKAVEMLRK